MGGTSVLKERFLNILAQYVPVSFDPNRDGALHVLESDNGLQPGDLGKARWIKAPEQRRAGQRVAHVVFGLRSETAANIFLRDGFYVEGKKVYGYKLLDEPIRCLKCQGLGHVVGQCKSIHDTCARCAGMHRTSECRATDEERACANCRNAKRAFEGHGTADRSCPVFTDKLQASLERNVAAKYPYFPIAEDPTSWATHEVLAKGLDSRQPEWQSAQKKKGDPALRPP
ncbi:hypothetical protein B0H17DRAFT_940071 [Mycena rosella]|uniref:CCHC-type domain-containing protein n=1 Tax=Mycena rosella TaxID=1033263 RepID=A0AAD7GE79_MYCRO|nr:hypothetical protein B0H17DRAFT_940071 [Mycena rosella]